jgi:hypothetical protein
LINHILLICTSVVIFEFVSYLRFVNIIKFNLKIYQKIIKLFSYKNVSDFRKEKLIFSYSKSLIITSIKIAVILISILVFILIINLLSDKYLNLLLSITGFIELIISYLLYNLIRKKNNAKL